MEPASPILPVKNQLIAKVSRVPKVRQLIALRTDREWESPPLNKITLGVSKRTVRFNHITAADCQTQTPLVRMRPGRRA
jgi:hypothetical protein